MPIKERRSKILLLLMLIGVSADKQFKSVTISPDHQQIFDIYLNQKTKGTLSVLLQEGLIEKQENTTYLLTEKGYQQLCLTFPYFRFLHGEWDGLWRVISYEIPEKKRELRDSLRREMKGWGLGPWHRSFWITPHQIISNLRDLVYGREEAQYIQAFESTHVFGDVNTLVEKVWQKSELEKKYREMFKNWHTILSEGKYKKKKKTKKK